MNEIKMQLNVKELRVPAEMKYLDSVIDYVMDELSYYNCSVKLQSQMALVVEELYCNIVTYAYQKYTGDIIIKCHIYKNRIVIVIEDNGNKFNPLNVVEPDITLQAEERNIGGLGIYLVKKTVDNISYEFLNGSNILTLMKFLS